MRTIHLPLVFLGVLSITSVLFAQIEKPSSPHRRPMAIDDLFRLETVRNAVFSPDGQWIAYERVRPLVNVKSFRNTSRLGDNDHSDIWIASVSDGHISKITDGLLDDCGYFHPIWSPESDKLVMYSTKGDSIHIWVWERRTGHLRQISDRSLETQWTGAIDARWLSDHELVAPVLPAGEQSPVWNFDSHAGPLQMAYWQKAWLGEVPTSSVLESGLQPTLVDRSRGSLVRLDTDTLSQKTILEGSFLKISLSPDRGLCAALRRISVRQVNAADQLADENQWKLNLEIVSLDNKAGHHEFPEYDVEPSSLVWSPHGEFLAFAATRNGLSQTNDHIYVYDRDHGSIVMPQQADIVPVVDDHYGDPPAICWNKEGQLVVLARRSGGGDRFEWYLLDLRAAARSLTTSLSEVPSALFLHPDGKRLVGLSSGHLVAISTDSSTVDDLTGAVRSVQAIAWPVLRSDEQQSLYDQTIILNTAILAREKNSTPTYEVFDVNSGVYKPYVLPPGYTSVEAYSQLGRAVISITNNDNGTYLSISKEGEQLEKPLATANEFLRTIKGARLQEICYRSLHGRDLKAWILLPPDYSTERRYPLVANVYPGLMQNDLQPSGAWAPWESNAHNIQLLAAHGFVVLVPSMPIENGDGGWDPLLDMTSGVLPAIDEAIELGIADPDRLGVMGQSGGGYAVYGLIGQTHLFKAAVAKSGMTDLLSFYGTFDARRRYDSDLPDFLGGGSVASWEESKAANRAGYSMGEPPWRDINRYIRNSPISYVGRVETPLLITSGDQDLVPIQQAEEFFSALYRQGKRARFVRYFGECHTYKSPANIKDQWEQIFKWFDEYLQPSSASTPHSQ